jgi:hypothetical protein
MDARVQERTYTVTSEDCELRPLQPWMRMSFDQLQNSFGTLYHSISNAAVADSGGELSPIWTVERKPSFEKFGGMLLLSWTWRPNGYSSDGWRLVEFVVCEDNKLNPAFAKGTLAFKPV